MKENIVFPADFAARIAPSGTFRVALNHGNPVLVQKNSETGVPEGVTVAIGRDLGARLNLPVRFMEYDTAGKVFGACKRDEWDLCFLAVDPVRAEEISFSEPYVLIRGSYMVKTESDFTTNKDVDQPGVRIAVGKNAAYDLFLSRNLVNAELIRAPSSSAAVDLFVSEGLEAAAGVSIPLQRYARTHPGVRVLGEHFMTIRQAVGVPRHREHLIDVINLYISALKTDGFIKAELDRSQQFDAEVAP